MSDDRKGPPKLDVEQILAAADPGEAVLEIEGFEVVDGESPAIPPPPAGGATEARAEAPVSPLAELEARHLRLRADFENYRRRVTQERDDLRERAAEDLLRELLPIVDNLGRGLAEAGSPDDPFRQGIELVHRQFLELLRREGVEPIAAVGQPFDPECHEAVSSQETRDVPPGSVAEEMQKGYRYRGRLLRPSLVRVAVAPAAPAGAAMRERASWEE